MIGVLFFLFLHALLYEIVHSLRLNVIEQPWRRWGYSITLKNGKECTASFTKYSLFMANKDEFLDVSNSLLTLLNLAQEVGSSNNLKFRQFADRLREQFNRSFALRYNLTREQLKLASAPLSGIDDLDRLNEDARKIRELICDQISFIEKSQPTSILFYNEPQDNLDKLKYPFIYPLNCIDPPPLYQSSTPPKSANNVKKKSIAELAATMDEVNRGKPVQSSYMKNYDSAMEIANIIRRTENAASKFKKNTAADKSPIINDLAKLKLGLREEAKKWRLEAVKVFGKAFDKRSFYKSSAPVGVGTY